MFEIRREEDGSLTLSGRFDAAQLEKAEAVLQRVEEPVTVDLSGLDYISSAGLGALLRAQKRLVASRGRGLRLVRPNRHIQDVFRFSGFDQVFEIDAAPGTT
ncbi:MAG: STAS domain-containing protein [Acidobacteria bacterium]|nr:STAS domain-containing protein [Acidobacteriota bacterium]